MAQGALALLLVSTLLLVVTNSAFSFPYLGEEPYNSMDYMDRFSRAGRNSIKQPVRPAAFKNQEELQKYLKDMRDYLNIIGRQRFGRSVDSQRNHPVAGKSTLLLEKDGNKVNGDHQ